MERPETFQHQNKKIILIAFILNCIFCFEMQSQNLSSGSRTSPIFENLMNGLPIARPQSGVKGDIYFNSQFSPCTFTLYDKDQTIEGYYARYNIYFDELDVKTQSGEKAIENSRIRGFILKDSGAVKFINASEYAFDKVPLKGFLQVLVEGAAPLFKRYSLIVKEPDYNPALSTGSRDTRIIKEYDLFYGTGKEVFKAKNKKKLMASFGDNGPKVETFLKENPASFSTEAGLIKIFTYYNSLLK